MPTVSVVPSTPVWITASRVGSLCAPVDVRWTFGDGTTETVRWTRKEQLASPWKRWVRRGPKHLSSAAIDPDRGYFLDRDLSNNRWFRRKDVVAPLRWTERAFSRALHVLHFQGGIGG